MEEESIYDTIDQRILQLLDTGFGEKHDVARSVKGIPEFPIDSFEEMRNLLLSGRAIIRQAPMSTGQGIFNLLATSSDSTLLTISTLITYIVPLVGVVLSFVFSWWFALLIIFFFIGIRFSKRIYLRTIFNRAANSELAFCLLFCGGYITIEIPGQGMFYR